MDRKAIPGFPGYMISRDGRVYSEWQPSGRGQGKGFEYVRAGVFREITTEVTNPNTGHRRVRLRDEKGTPRKCSVPQLVSRVWGHT